MSRQSVINAAKEVMNGPLPVRIVCPICLGGSDHEECMVVWESDGNVYATCHRARCEVNTYLVSGSINTTERVNWNRRPDTLEKPKTYAKGGPLTDTDLEYIKRKCGEQSFLATGHRPNGMYAKSYPLWTRSSWESGGLMLPMYDVNGEERGCVIKPYADSLPKSLTYKDPDYDGMSWYLDTSHMLDGRIVLVEDGLSALALLGKGISSVSLNGTLLNLERMRVIFRYKKVGYLALDADATSKSLQYAIRFGSAYKLKVMRLMKDFKNMTSDELDAVLKEYEL